MRACFENGVVLVAEQEEKIVGVAVLQASGDKDIDLINVNGPEYDKLVAVVGTETINDFIHMCEKSDYACHSLPDPKWHLVLLAVSGQRKGQGIGSRMLKECIIPYIAENGAGLLTFNTNAETNRRFYKRNGFEEFDETYLKEKGILLGNWSYRMTIKA